MPDWSERADPTRRAHPPTGAERKRRGPVLPWVVMVGAIVAAAFLELLA